MSQFRTRLKPIRSLPQYLSRSVMVLLVIVAIANLARGQSQTPPGLFSFHLNSEPVSLNPAQFSATDAGYLFPNLLHGLYTYGTDTGLRPEGAKECVFENPKKMICVLDPRVRWSDGSVVTAHDYVRGFQNLVGPKAKNPGVEILSTVMFALEAHAGTKKPEEIGVKALSDTRLQIEFAKPDPDFLFKLISPLLVPVKTTAFPDRKDGAKYLVNGPYKIKEWISGKRIRLEPNPYYGRGRADRPPVEVYFVDDDETALSLYERGQLTFLRRLSATNIPTHSKRADFLQIPVTRFDYLGFGDFLKDQSHYRRALSQSLNFDEFKALFNALGAPGCPSLPDSYMDKTPCLTFDPKAAKAALEKVPKEIRSKRLKFAFSRLGGDDLKRGAEWMQAQWKKHLGITVDLEQTENGVLLQSLQSSPPPLFRKGIGLDRPTCLAALETFASDGSENFLRLKDERYDNILGKLRQSGVSKKEKQKLCGDGVRILLAENRLIPLGRIHFTMLMQPRYKGWHVNDMNQLDLADLHEVKVP